MLQLCPGHIQWHGCPREGFAEPVRDAADDRDGSCSHHQMMILALRESSSDEDEIANGGQASFLVSQEILLN
ncbi:MAG: hypothetical protein ACPIOQ_49790 [Promethearchaeia archaeon]